MHLGGIQRYALADIAVLMKCYDISLKMVHEMFLLQDSTVQRQPSEFSPSAEGVLSMEEGDNFLSARLVPSPL
ncbi:hypothetical protein Taro_028220 [Colocasia esculenta]|uniref:Uncharacterized protein n=1 Tax=Colocasia esculenta TaxID=4460 RepID=A0A843VPU2_COLES|nr:hypothetical protein [Colocasia esculenta]